MSRLPRLHQPGGRHTSVQVAPFLFKHTQYIQKCARLFTILSQPGHTQCLKEVKRRGLEKLQSGIQFRTMPLAGLHQSRCGHVILPRLYDDASGEAFEYHTWDDFPISMFPCPGRLPHWLQESFGAIRCRLPWKWFSMLTKFQNLEGQNFVLRCIDNYERNLSSMIYLPSRSQNGLPIRSTVITKATRMIG